MWYYNKFESKKSVGVCYWCVKIPQCNYMEHELKHIPFYVQKHISALATCYNRRLIHDKPLGALASMTLVYWVRSETWMRVNWWQYMSINVAHDLMMIILLSDSQFIWRSMMLTIGSREENKCLISFSESNTYTINRTGIHMDSRQKYKGSFCGWDWNIPGNMGQFHDCWCPS